MFDSIQISAIPALEKGAAHQLEVLGIKAGDDPVNITLNCIFKVADKVLASIDNKGVLTALNGGITAITAKYGALTASANAAISVVIDPDAPPAADPTLQTLNSRLNFFETALSFLGKIEADQMLMQFVAAHPFTLATDFAGSKAVAAVAGASENTVIGFRKNGTQFGGVAFAGGSLVGVFTPAAAQKFMPGDILTAVVISADAAFESPSVTFYGEPDAKCRSHG